MKLTNKHSAHHLIVSAIENSDTHRTYGDISVTQLIDSPQIRMLRKTGNYEVDVMSRIAMLFGTAGHQVLEYSIFKNSKVKRFVKGMESMNEMINSSKDDAFKAKMQSALDLCVLVFKEFLAEHLNAKILLEHPMTITIDGMTVSGTLDYFDIIEKTLNDFKFIGVYSYINREHITKYEPQQNIYTLMLEQIPEKNFEVEKLEIVAVFKDWSKGKLKMNNYPPFPAMTIPIRKWGSEKTVAYMKERVRLHRLAEEKGIMECTPDEMWASGDVWKVFEKKKARAKKVCDSPESAQQWIDNEQITRDNKLQKPGEFYVEFFPGERRRCAGYCDVSDICEQYAKWKKDSLKNTKAV